MNARTRRHTHSRAFGAMLAAIATALLVPAGAHAGLNASAGARAGLAASAQDCDAQELSRPFLPWLDPFSYTMPTGGSFESGTGSWTLRGGAAIVDGNETHSVHGEADSRSLSLPQGSSATSSTICVGLLHPTLRFFARNKGFLLSTLRVEVHFTDAAGRERALPIGVVVGTGSWQPTLPYPVLANLLPLLSGERTPIEFKFVPQGFGGKWRIDDVYVDPYRRS